MFTMHLYNNIKFLNNVCLFYLYFLEEPMYNLLDAAIFSTLGASHWLPCLRIWSARITEYQMSQPARSLLRSVLDLLLLACRIHFMQYILKSLNTKTIWTT